MGVILNVGALFLVWLVLSLVAKGLERRQVFSTRALSLFRLLVLPSGALFYCAVGIAALPREDTLVRILATIFWGSLVWEGALLAKVMLLARLEGRGLEEQKTPALLIDLIRFPLLLIAVFFIFAEVWQRDFGSLLTTFGVGSLVVGLALQDTLGNLFAGIALFIEKPFQVGHWIRVNEVLGKIVELNWRAVRVLTRNGDLVIIPNSVLGKERIENYSFPTDVHATVKNISFSYDNPPNQVKRVLCECALATFKVLPDPQPVARTIGYGDSAINYEVKFFVRDFAGLPGIEEEFFTRVWYAARREQLSIPFPIRTVFKTEVPPLEKPDCGLEIEAALAGVDLFAPLSKEELAEVRRQAVSHDYGVGERVLRQGEKNRAFYIIRSGRVVVTLVAAGGIREELNTLKVGDFFGEMSVLTGDDCTADVTALEDLRLVVVYKDALQELLARRPALAEQMAQVVEKRRQGIYAADGRAHALVETAAKSRETALPLVDKIKKFFGLVS